MFKKDFIITDIASVAIIPSGDVGRFRNMSGKISHNELIFKAEGKTKITFGKYSFTDEKGSVRFFSPSDTPVNYTTEVLETGKCIDIIFDTLTPVDENPFSVKVKNKEKISALFLKAENAWHKKQDGCKNMVMGYLYEIIGLIQGEAKYVPDHKARKIKKGIDYIAEHFREEIVIENLSDMCGISHTYFKKIFKDLFGITPKAYIIQLRMQYACDLLVTKQYKINEIAEMCGYQNAFYFSNSFKAFSGISPSEYTNKN